MMTLYFPKIILSLFSYLEAATFEMPTFGKFFELHFDKSKIENRPSWDYRFKNQNIESTNVLLN